MLSFKRSQIPVVYRRLTVYGASRRLEQGLMKGTSVFEILEASACSYEIESSASAFHFYFQSQHFHSCISPLTNVKTTEKYTDSFNTKFGYHLEQPLEEIKANLRALQINFSMNSSVNSTFVLITENSVKPSRCHKTYAIFPYNSLISS